jgi:hypothetical protein
VQQQRVAVRRRFDDAVGGDDGAAAGDVFDDEILVEFLRMRAVWSVGPPAGYGTTMVTVRLGYCCAVPGAPDASRPIAARTIAVMRFILESSLVFVFYR